MKNKSIKIILFIATYFLLSVNTKCKTIEITELMPNPKGKDAKNEWMELYNGSNQNINLENWCVKISKISDPNAKPKKIILKSPFIIQAQNLFTLDSSNSKIQLRNSDLKIELFDSQGKLIDNVAIIEALEGLSYSKIKVATENSAKIIWEWTSPTKNTKNKTLKDINCEIISSSEILTQNFFEIKAKNGETSKIYFDPKEFDPNFFKIILREGIPINLLIEADSEKFFLRSYQLKNYITKNSQDETSAATIEKWMLDLLLIAIIIFMIYKATE